MGLALLFLFESLKVLGLSMARFDWLGGFAE
jgi:hypothetical protein